jgi:spore maturation protein CgeB
VVFGRAPISAGTLAQLKVSCACRAILVWPDTLLNLAARVVQCLPVYEFVASYSRSATESFRQLGARAAEWIPLGSDPDLHGGGTLAPGERERFDADICFVGNWRPEREAVLADLTSIEGLRVKIWGGPDWQRCCASRLVRALWQKEPLVGAGFAKAVQASKINLNIIDPTNYPAANMRFFEIPTAGGLQVSSACPEMEAEFRHGEEIFYYQSSHDLRGLIPDLLRRDTLRESVAAAGHAKVIAQHTYLHRARAMLAV